MSWIDDYKGSGPWAFTKMWNKPNYNEADKIAPAPGYPNGTPVWDMTDNAIGATPVTPHEHDPWCGYWPTRPYIAPVASPTALLVGLNIEEGRIVSLDIGGALTRTAALDNGDPVVTVARCYGLCYDVTNQIGYAAINDIPGTYSIKVVKFDVATMAVLNTLVLSTSAILLQNMSDHPTKTGLIYAQTRLNAAPRTATLYEIDAATFTVSRSVAFTAPNGQRNGLYPDEERGYLYYAGQATSNLMRFDLSATFTDDATICTVTDPTNHWGIIEMQYNRATGKAWVVHPNEATIYYPEHWSITEIDVDTMSVIRTVEFPTLPSGTGLQPTKLAFSDTHLYALCEDGNTGNTGAYLATVLLSDFSFLGYDPVAVSGGDGWVNVLGDLSVMQSTNELFVYVNGGDADMDPAGVYQRYDISAGKPVLTEELMNANDGDSDQTTTVLAPQDYTV